MPKLRRIQYKIVIVSAATPMDMRIVPMACYLKITSDHNFELSKLPPDSDEILKEKMRAD